MKKIKIGLLARIVIAIILGIAIGTVFPAPLVRIFVTFNGIFSEFLNFSIPLIIVGLVTVAIADIGKGAGKMLLLTALIAYFATLFSGFLSYFTGVTIFPSLIEPGAPLEEVSAAQGILPYFSVSIPPLMNVMTALVLAFTLGLGLASLNSDALKNVARDFQEIIVRMISAVILPLLPLYIFGIFLNMTHSGQVYSILMVFIKIIGVIFVLHIFLLVFQYSIAALFVHKNPFKLLIKMLPAYFTALGTQSSAATIPVTLEQVYAWDPDLIFVTNFTTAQPQDLYDNTVGSYDWSGVNAVQNQQAFKMPLGMYRSYTPGVDTPITLLWLAKSAYPALFEDIDITQQTVDYYKTVFDVTLTEAQAEAIFTPVADAAGGF